MTFEQLRVLHAIVTEGTFRRAAQTLFKSQPALSNMMKKLEQEVGFEI
ncbi:MAG: LysR family transcriptional regulator, partial [Gammaproteobacteria bacterium]|nr:LysR family transcriptional regulator [Gammaproteobacteria bacterium]